MPLSDVERLALVGDFPVPENTLEGNKFISPTLSTDEGRQALKIPSLAEMRNLSQAELVDLLQHYGVVQPWGVLQAQAAEYVARMSEIRPGTPEFAAEISRLTDAGSKRGALGLARRTAQQWSTLDSIQGNVNQEMIWVSEDDESTCDACEPRGGEIRTFAEWQALGPPGAAVCRGGDYCRCDLIVID